MALYIRCFTPHFVEDMRKIILFIIAYTKNRICALACQRYKNEETSFKHTSSAIFMKNECLS